MSNMLRKKEVFTVVTPIPGFIPRQLAIDILHSHSEVITLNPLVLTHKPISAPRDAAADEFYSTWYEITERIQYIPGMGKMGSGKISFNGCFHDMPWGLQTHIYAPMNVDLRNKYRIAGNQPGVEPPEPPEIGMADLGVPADGLYLREDIEIKCNVAMMSFVKSQLKAASKEMVQRIIKKAELLDAGVLRAMIEDGKLKTFNPNDRSNRASTMNINSTASTAPSNYNGPSSPGLSYHGSVGHGQAPLPYYAGMQQQQRQTSPQGMGYPGALPQQAMIKPPEPQGPIEMPGDFYHPQASPTFAPPQAQNSPTFPSQSNRSSYISSHQSQQMDPRLSDPHRMSMTSQGSITQTPAGYTTPQPDQKGWEAGPAYSAELPGHSKDAPAGGKGAPPPYNPQSYANMR